MPSQWCVVGIHTMLYNVWCSEHQWCLILKVNNHSTEHKQQEAASSHHEHAVRPPVGAVRVSSSVHHLRSHILHRPTEGVSLVLVVYRLLAEAKV